MPGELFALLAAMTWAFALVLFKYSGERVPPLALNLFKCVVGVGFLGLTLLAAPLAPTFLADETLATVRSTPAGSIPMLIVSGVIGIALADSLFFFTLNRLGVGLTSIVDCLYSPSVIAFAWLLLPGEKLTLTQLIGAALILSGVFVSTGHKPPPNTTRGQLVVAVIVGSIAMACMAFGIVIAKPALEGFPLIWASTIRLVAGTVVLALVALVSPARRSLWKVFRPSRAWKTAVPGAFLGTYLAYVFWIAGFKYADASISAILNQTTVIFAVILATFVMREPMTRRKLAAVALAVLGVVAVLSEHFLKLLGAAS